MGVFAGLVAWTVFVALRLAVRGRGEELIVATEAIFLLAPLALVPMGLESVRAPSREGQDTLAFRVGRRLALPAALLLGLSLFVPAGWRSALLVAPWLQATFALALHGLSRLARRSRFRAEELAIDVALLYLPVGAVWAMVYRSGASLLGFWLVEALFTATHFHYAGLGACLVAGLAGRLVQRRGGALSKLYPPVALSVVLGVALLALGIALWRPLELAAAFFVSAAVAASGALLLALALTPRQLPRGRPVARLLLALAGLSSFVSMFFAARFALSGFAALTAEGWRQMVLWHGAANALGFVGAGLSGLVLLGPEPLSAPPGAPFSRFASRGYVGPRFFEVQSALGEGSPTGLVDRLGDFGGPLLDVSAVDPAVRDFYERTNRYALAVAPAWQPGFRLGGRIWRALTRRVGQLNLPVSGGAGGMRLVESRILPLSEEKDGRPGARAWVRSYEAEGDRPAEPIYVAAYASHLSAGRRLMNVAFPLPFGNLTSILRMEARSGGGVRVTTLPREDLADGDEGVWLVGGTLASRLPMNEK